MGGRQEEDQQIGEKQTKELNGSKALVDKHSLVNFLLILETLLEIPLDVCCPRCGYRTAVCHSASRPVGAGNTNLEAVEGSVVLQGQDVVGDGEEVAVSSHQRSQMKSLD